jgi:aminomethyltransferase
VGQVIYCCWCDEEGKVIDDGTITRLEENDYRWTAADPSLRWFRQNALGLDLSIEDISAEVAALALQGPTSGRLLMSLAGPEIADLKYFRFTRAKIAGVDVDISRTGYTGDLGYEIWMPWSEAPQVWDALMAEGRQFDIHPAGMLALDVARIEAGLILIEVDYFSSKKAMIESQKYSPYEIGLGRLVNLNKEYFIGRAALAGGLGYRLAGHRKSVRFHRPRAAGGQHRVARCGSGLRRAWTPPGRQSHFHYLVAHAQENDRAGQRRSRTFRRGHRIAH